MIYRDANSRYVPPQLLFQTRSTLIFRRNNDFDSNSTSKPGILLNQIDPGPNRESIEKVDPTRERELEPFRSLATLRYISRNSLAPPLVVETAANQSDERRRRRRKKGIHVTDTLARDQRSKQMARKG